MSLLNLYSQLKTFLFAKGSPLPVCLFRIFYGLALLEYCLLMAPELLTCMSDTNGILRIQTLKHIFGIPVINLLTALPPGDNWIIAFFSIFVIACICLTLGLFSRVSIFLVYLGLVSLQHRNIYVHHSGDHLFLLAAFYLLFAPIDATLSLDRIRRIWFPKKTDLPKLIPDAAEPRSLWAVKAYKVQFALIYWQTSWAKIAALTWWDGTAMYYVFRHAEFARFFVPIVPENMFLMKVFTWSAMLIEFCAWIFIWFKETRYYVLLSLIALHLGIDYAMNIPLFEQIMLVSLINFIPAEDLSKFMEQVRSAAAPYLGAPVTIAYNGSLTKHIKIASTIKSLDILRRIELIDIHAPANDRSLPDNIRQEAQTKITAQWKDSSLQGVSALKMISRKLPFCWPFYPVLALLR
jgi:hypothetical protein